MICACPSGDIKIINIIIFYEVKIIIQINKEVCSSKVEVSKGVIYSRIGKGIRAISSNDIENYPQDAPEFMQKVAQDLGYPFPYLYDETQEVAKAYDAACTPDFYLFDDFYLFTI